MTFIVKKGKLPVKDYRKKKYNNAIVIAHWDTIHIQLHSFELTKNIIRNEFWIEERNSNGNKPHLTSLINFRWLLHIFCCIRCSCGTGFLISISYLQLISWSLFPYSLSCIKLQFTVTKVCLLHIRFQEVQWFLSDLWNWHWSKASQLKPTYLL